MEAGKIEREPAKFVIGVGFIRAFTLIEMLVVISIISILMAILLPVLNRARSEARKVININNQKQVVSAVNLFSVDNDSQYPPSVSYNGSSGDWNWYDPRTLTSWNLIPDYPHRAMSEYLGAYIEDADVMFCPNAPQRPVHLQRAWDEGDQWDNPDFTFNVGVFRGSYCFYWNYVGLLENDRLFVGPRSSISGNSREGKILMSCYFGFDHMKTQGAYSSCERLQKAQINDETWMGSAWWYRQESPEFNSETIATKLHAGYTDGHVEEYRPSETSPMQVIANRIKKPPVPYSSNISPGIYYLPKNGLP